MVAATPTTTTLLTFILRANVHHIQAGVSELPLFIGSNDAAICHLPVRLMPPCSWFDLDTTVVTLDLLVRTQSSFFFFLFFSFTRSLVKFFFASLALEGPRSGPRYIPGVPESPPAEASSPVESWRSITYATNFGRSEAKRSESPSFHDPAPPEGGAGRLYTGGIFKFNVETLSRKRGQCPRRRRREMPTGGEGAKYKRRGTTSWYDIGNEGGGIGTQRTRRVSGYFLCVVAELVMSRYFCLYFLSVGLKCMTPGAGDFVCAAIPPGGGCRRILLCRDVLSLRWEVAV